MLGARVVVEPTPLPTAQHARWNQAGDYEEDLLPQPRMPDARISHSNDNGLEYDVLGSQEPSYAADAAISVSPSMRSPLDMELSVNEPDHMAGDRALRRPRQVSIDLEQGAHSPGLELDAASTPARERTETSTRTERNRPEPRVVAAPQPAARRAPAPSSTMPAPHGRASVVEHSAYVEGKSNTPHLLQLLCAIAIIAIGYWADSSVIFGSAGLWSIAAHGVALYLLFLGVRGLVT
jgi:hypothetical protein